MVELSVGLLNALKNYYRHRDLQEQVKWDKPADLLAIDDIATKDGWHWESCAGTFWFKMLIGVRVQCTMVSKNKKGKPMQIETKWLNADDMQRSELFTALESAMTKHDRDHPEQPPYFSK